MKQHLIIRLRITNDGSEKIFSFVIQSLIDLKLIDDNGDHKRRIIFWQSDKTINKFDNLF